MFALHIPFVFILTSPYFFVIYGAEKHDVYFKNLEVYSYRHFGSLQTIYFEVPLDTSSFSWNLTINKSRPGCEDHAFYLYMQHGSFPIDKHDGLNTFPCTYKIGRTGLFMDNLTSSKSIVTEQPFYGQWFLGALMKENANQVVKKLSSLWCDYGLLGNMTYFIEDVSLVIPGTKMDINMSLQSQYFRFMTGRNIYKYSVALEISNQSLSSSSCDITIITRSGALPRVSGDSPAYNLTCTSSTPSCKMEFDVYSPEVEKWQYLLIQNNVGKTIVVMQLVVNLFECMTGVLRNRTMNRPCYLSQPLLTITYPDEVQHSIFSFSYDKEESVLVPRPFVSMTTFTVDKFKDIGGTLSLDLMMNQIDKTFDKVRWSSSEDQDFAVIVCIQRGHATVSEDGQLLCRDKNVVRLNFTNPHAEVRFLYPEPGIYFIGHQDLKQNQSDGHRDPQLGLFVKAKVTSCEDSKCQNGGKCHNVMKGPFVMSYCYCLAGSRGITCSDDSNMLSRPIQMLYTLLLTLSNLAFIPAIVISFKRWRYMECIIYFINMFCSAFYHACDMNQWSVYSLCFLQYRLYQFADFYLSLLSFWVTLLAMSRIKSGYMIPGLVSGIVIIGIMVESNPSGPIINIIPIATGTLIVIISWGLKSYKNKAIYPNKREFLWIVPGVAMAGFGLIVFAFIENDVNYPYTHSVWHLCVAFCIPLVLPRDKVVWELNEITQARYSVPQEFNSGSEDDEVVLIQNLQPTQYVSLPSHSTSTPPLDDHQFNCNVLS